jgi:hypothetical protein
MNLTTIDLNVGQKPVVKRRSLPMKTIQLLALFLTATVSFAADPPAEPKKAVEPKKVTETKKPTVKLADDGYPTGSESPEGAACDLARAFIKRDWKLFQDTCVSPYLGGEARKAYEKFLADTTASIQAEAKKTKPSGAGPKSIGKVFGARHLSLNGPGSYAYAVLGCQDVMFVDVGCFLHNGGKFLSRTLVVKTKKGDWLAHPMPTNDSFLSAGLNDEKDSTEDFSEHYDIPKR